MRKDAVLNVHKSNNERETGKCAPSSLHGPKYFATSVAVMTWYDLDAKIENGKYY